MIRKPCPIRAEGSDIANAILDGSYSIMLPGEPGKGDYPLQTVRMPHMTAHEAEAASFCLHRSAVEASFKGCSGTISVLTMSDRRAHQAVRYHPNAPLLSLL